jgi:hypothetical protein
MFKVDLNIFPKFLQINFFKFVDYLNKQNKLQIDEILDFLLSWLMLR